MSNKPLKHSERKRAQTAASRMKGTWGRGRALAPTLHIKPERILIVTEGEKTEPLYFEGFRRRINESYGRDYVTVEVHGLGDNTVSLFNRARALAERDIEGFTQVWVVYDRDSFPTCDFNVVPELCASATNDCTVYRAAWTNEAFELWYLLHFEYMDSALNRGSFGPRLTSILQQLGHGAYQKNRADMFYLLEGLVDRAVANAKRLEEVNQGMSPADCNPGTTVHLLIEELRPYLLRPEDQKLVSNE